MASVFLSYDRDDSTRARHFANALEKAGHEVWWDLHVRGGTEFSEAIENALNAADAVVVLWSANAIKSAWVRDEASAGRDSGRLVPVTIDGTPPPLGFRQYQTIDLSQWKGRGRGPRFAELLDTVESKARSRPVLPSQGSDRPQRAGWMTRRWLLPLAGVALIACVAIALWSWLGRDRLPVVEVAAADQSARSQAAASDLFVKLGSLAQVGEGKWQLVDASSAPSRTDLVFRTADTGSPSQPQASLVLLGGEDEAALWSREFKYPAGGEADLRQQLSLTAGRVLGCALESRAGRLRRDLLKLFLNACSTLAETPDDQSGKIAQSLRAIIDAQPRFAPAWSRLIQLDIAAVDAAVYDFADAESSAKILRADMAKARSYAPDLPELILAQAKLLPADAYGEQLKLIEKASAAAPDDPQLLSAKLDALSRVGRQQEAATVARRAFELDPLSPTADTQFIMALAYAGNIDTARKELARAERTWSGTGALRQTLWAFYLRFGDPKLATQYAPNGVVNWYRYYLGARQDPSAANLKALADYIHKNRSAVEPGAFSVAAQALGEFNQRDEFFAYVADVPAINAANTSYVLFRPGLAGIRRDPRFMMLAKRIGLVDYWRTSGKWPDFCDDELPYDCKEEAAKVSA